MPIAEFQPPSGRRALVFHLAFAVRHWAICFYSIAGGALAGYFVWLADQAADGPRKGMIPPACQ
jgi:hypothetical protein